MLFVDILVRGGEYLFFVSVGLPIRCLFVNITSCLSKIKTFLGIYPWVN